MATKNVPHPITVTATQALDYVDVNYAVIVAFATQESFSETWNVVHKKCDLLDIKVVRVEPTEDNAVDLQVSRHPTYILYQYGSESWMVLGNEEFSEKIDAMRS